MLIQFIKYNRLDRIIVLSTFCMARAASQRFVSRQTTSVCFFEPCIMFSSILFRIKKTRIEILRRSVQVSARKLRSETISCVFGWCPYQNTPRLSWSLQQGWKTYLICWQNEVQIVQHILLGPRSGPKDYFAKFGFLWAANQPGLPPQAVNIHHPTELSTWELEHIFLVRVSPQVWCVHASAARSATLCATQRTRHRMSFAIALDLLSAIRIFLWCSSIIIFFYIIMLHICNVRHCRQ